jgi:hypothetical protein
MIGLSPLLVLATPFYIWLISFKIDDKIKSFFMYSPKRPKAAGWY